jgi:hypothetical protein
VRSWNPPGSDPDFRRTASRLTLACSLLFGMTFAASGCELGNSPTPNVPRGADGKTCAERLVGAWHMIGFTPDVPPDATTAKNLQSVQSQVRLVFDGQMATTTGPGIQSGSPYRVDSDDGVSCRVLAPDTTGAVSEKLVRFPDPGHLEVLDRQSAVPGRGSWERTQ